MTDKKQEPEKKETPKPAPALKPVSPKPQAGAKLEACIYVGPNLRNGKLMRYTIFKDGELMPHVKALADEHKAIKRLIVPVSKLAMVESSLRDKASTEASFYAEAAQIKFNKGE